jgi:hypothetical protein
MNTILQLQTLEMTMNTDDADGPLMSTASALCPTHTVAGDASPFEME